MTEHELLVDKAARAIGWFDYPSDSIECGNTWHTDKEKAPFDRIVLKRDFDPLSDWDDAMLLATRLMMSISTGPCEARASTRLAIVECAAAHYEEQTND